MKLPPFALERYFAPRELAANAQLSCSDCEALSLADVVAGADEPSSRLWFELRLGYMQTRGSPLLRAEIASLYDGVGVDDVLCCAPSEGIFLAISCAPTSRPPNARSPSLPRARVASPLRASTRARASCVTRSFVRRAPSYCPRPSLTSAIGTYGSASAGPIFRAPSRLVVVDAGEMIPGDLCIAPRTPASAPRAR